MATFGKKEQKNANWSEAHWGEMQPVTERKRKVLLAHKQSPCISTCDARRAARSRAQQTARRCTNKYWQNLCSNIHLAADCGNAKEMYKGIKIATGPTRVKSVPLKEKNGKVITDQSKQLQHWAEHYLDLYPT